MLCVDTSALVIGLAFDRNYQLDILTTTSLYSLPTTEDSASQRKETCTPFSRVNQNYQCPKAQEYRTLEPGFIRSHRLLKLPPLFSSSLLQTALRQ